MYQLTALKNNQCRIFIHNSIWLLCITLLLDHHVKHTHIQTCDAYSTLEQEHQHSDERKHDKNTNAATLLYDSVVFWYFRV